MLSIRCFIKAFYEATKGVIWMWKKHYRPQPFGPLFKKLYHYFKEERR